MTWNERVYFLLGGSGGIGTALTQILRDRGATVVVAARDESRLRLCSEGTGAHTVPVDGQDFDAVEAAVGRAVERFGRLDGAVNLAGSILLKPAHTTSQAEYTQTVAQNLTTAFALVRASARVMTAPGHEPGGSIVLMTSVAARTGLPSHEAIAAAKAGVIGLTQSAAASYASKGVRVNCVSPGLVRTPMSERLTSNESSLKASIAMHPLGRIGEPGDVARAVAWLLDPEQSWVTGQVIGVDGGLGAVRAR